MIKGRANFESGTVWIETIADRARDGRSFDWIAEVGPGCSSLRREVEHVRPSVTARSPLKYWYEEVGEEGLEPSRLAAHDPKSCSSANFDIPPSERHRAPSSLRFYHAQPQ